MHRRAVAATPLKQQNLGGHTCNSSSILFFFKPIRIDVGSYGEEFVDGATGANNPIVELWNQAQDLWPGKLEDNLKCLVSIDTGVCCEEQFQCPAVTSFGLSRRAQWRVL